jgi:hypothetical protein
MTDQQIARIRPHMRWTLYHLLKCWDELQKIEQILDQDIDTSSLYSLAAEFGPAEDALTVTAEQIAEWRQTLPRW